MMRLAIGAIALLLMTTPALANGVTPPVVYGDEDDEVVVVPAPVVVSKPVRTPSDWYIGAYGGGNWLNDASVSEPFPNHSVDVSTDTGYVIGGVVGKRIRSVPGLRIEADLNYRSNDFDVTVHQIAPPAVVWSKPGDDQTWAFMGNAAYDIPVGKFPVKPYIMAGAGYGARDIDVNNGSLTLSETGFVWQAGGGINVVVSDDIQVDIGYRYFDAPNVDRNLGGGIVVDADGTNHSFIVGAKFALN